HVRDRELSVAARLPMHARRSTFTRAAGEDLHALGDDERGIEPDAELADELRVLLLVAGEPREELGRPRAGDGAEVLDRLRPAHADAVVDDGDRARVLVRLDPDRELGAP